MGIKSTIVPAHQGTKPAIDTNFLFQLMCGLEGLIPRLPEAAFVHAPSDILNSVNSLNITLLIAGDQME